MSGKENRYRSCWYHFGLVHRLIKNDFGMSRGLEIDGREGRYLMRGVVVNILVLDPSATE